MRRISILAAAALVTACSSDAPTYPELRRSPSFALFSATTTFIGGPATIPDAINDDGVAVGHFRSTAGPDHAFRWTAGGGFVDIHSASGSTWWLTRAGDVSNAGHVVGHGYESMTNQNPIAWIWTPTDATLRRLTAGPAYARGVNSSGLVVGYFLDGNVRKAAAWTANGDQYVINGASDVYDVNDLGQAVTGVVGNGFVIWNPLTDPRGDALRHVRATDFPLSGLSYLQPLGISPDGRVVGFGGTAAGDRAFVWTPGAGTGTLQILASLPGASRSIARSMNASGEIVGSMSVDMGRTTHAIYWENTSAPPVILPDPLVGPQALAHSINASGKVVGVSVGSTFLMRGVLWDVRAAPPNQPPIANAGPDQVLECVNAMANATLDGRASSDPDGQIVNYEWRWLALNQVVANGPTPTLPLGQGVHDFALKVTDNSGASAEDGVRVEVRDMSPPEIQVTQHATELWPPDRRMVRVVSGIKSTDVCAGGASVNVSITSNEAIEGDYQIVSTLDGYEVHVRATRDARNADGRTYTITMSANDGTYQATRVASILVPRAPR